jgi:vacuolar-type H+-ATPase subunit F/Vma7
VVVPARPFGQICCSGTSEWGRITLKILNCGAGIHAREITGVSLLAGLPDHWFAYTNLDLATATATSREIDIIIVAEDRRRSWKSRPRGSREKRRLPVFLADPVMSFLAEC